MRAALTAFILRTFEALKGPVARFIDSRIRPKTDALILKPILRHVNAKMATNLSLFTSHACFSILACATSVAFSVAFSPVVCKKSWKEVSKSDRRVWHTNLGCFFPAFFVPLFAVPAVLKFPGDGFGEGGMRFVRKATEDTFRACGLSLGYMAWDLAMLLENPAGQQQAYGGKGAYYLYIMHHLFSMCCWPYAVFAGRCVWFVNYFLVSEVTNANMTLRWFLLRCKMEKTRTYLFNGLTWVPLFLIVRICVIPSMVRAFLFGTWDKLTLGEKIVAFTTLPIPSMLNIYWARMIVSNAIEYLRTWSSSKDQDEVNKSKSD